MEPEGPGKIPRSRTQRRWLEQRKLVIEPSGTSWNEALTGETHLDGWKRLHQHSGHWSCKWMMIITMMIIPYKFFKNEACLVFKIQ